MHRALQLLLNTHGTVSHEDIALAISDGGTTTYFMVKKTISRLRHAMPAGQVIVSVKNHGYKVIPAPKVKCRACPTEITIPRGHRQHARTHFCAPCGVAYRIGLKEGRRKPVAAKKEMNRVRRSVVLGSGAGAGLGQSGEGSGGGVPKGQP